MSGRSCSIFVSALGLALVAGCGGSGDSVGRGAEETVTATTTVIATTTVTATATPPPTEVPPDPTIRALFGLVEREYAEGTLRVLAESICQEARTGEGDPSNPWREEIGYIGERRLGAFIAYSVATYCPEEVRGLIGLMGGRLSQVG